MMIADWKRLYHNLPARMAYVYHSRWVSPDYLSLLFSRHRLGTVRTDSVLCRNLINQNLIHLLHYYRCYCPYPLAAIAAAASPPSSAAYPVVCCHLICYNMCHENRQNHRHISPQFLLVHLPHFPQQCTVVVIRWRGSYYRRRARPITQGGMISSRWH